MAYYSDTQTERMLNKLTKQIRGEYSKAYKEMKEYADDFYSQLEPRFEAELEKFNNGQTKYKDINEFNNWKLTQIKRANGYYAMAQKLSDEMVRANQTASAYINDTTPSIYSLNQNYEAYRLEQAYGIDFSITDPQTVKELMLGENHTEFRVTSIDPLRDYEWNNKQIHSALTSAILQGKSIGQLADAYMEVMQRNRASAIRNARTSVTSAQNAGRNASYKLAYDMGINVQKQWLATLDGVTRHSHAKLDGARVAHNAKFANGLRYPADPLGSPAEVYNCRCTLIAYLPEYDDGIMERTYRNEEGHTEFGSNGKPIRMKNTTYTGVNGTNSYKEWLAQKTAKAQAKASSALVKSGYNFVSAVGQKLANSNIDFVDVQRLTEQLTSNEIAKKISGGDMTAGSCSSSAFAFIGNKAGYDVLDFRDGESRLFFANRGNILEIAQLKGVESKIVEEYNDFVAAKKLIKTMQEGKEYYMACGCHAAIVKFENGHFSFIELQDADSCGYRPANLEKMGRRFGMQKSHSVLGSRFKLTSVLIDVESLYNNDEFINMLGFINTNYGKQIKGALGHVK